MTPRATQIGDHTQADNPIETDDHEPPSGQQPSGLVLAGTPIGNPGDASENLRAALTAADVIACEDTRRTRRLLADLGIRPHGRLVTYHDHNEADQASVLVEQVQGGAKVVVVSDAGMPAVSDPGFRVVARAVACGVEPRVLPGPSAVTVALALSGLPTDRFCFEGFAPRKAGALTAFLEMVRDEPRTVVFFESPRRLGATLAAAATVWDASRRVSVSRELTKTYEQTMRGTIAEVADWAGERQILGEITVCVEPAPKRSQSVEELADEVLALAAEGNRLKDASKQVAARQGVSARELFAAAVQARDTGDH